MFGANTHGENLSKICSDSAKMRVLSLFTGTCFSAVLDSRRTSEEILNGIEPDDGLVVITPMPNEGSGEGNHIPGVIEYHIPCYEQREKDMELMNGPYPLTMGFNLCL